MSKLRRDARLVIAGACSGLFSASVFLLGGRVVTYYDYLIIREEYVEDLWWVPVVAWHVVLSIAACLLMHRYLPPSRASIFLRWQAIGMVALAGWVLTMATAIGLDCLVRGGTHPIAQALSEFRFITVSQFVASVFASNVLFGSAIRAASMESSSEATRVAESDA